MIEMLDHNADVGFELGASTPEELFDEARRAPLMVVFERPPEEGEEVVEIRLSAPPRDAPGAVAERVELPDPGRGACPGRRGDRAPGSRGGIRARSAPLLLEEYRRQGEVKSATLHGLEIEDSDGRLRARVILDA
jgi:SHS2 domain-containing protein